ncbi:hypothetical protein MHYP_G00348740 [Metynnis hypsauchen]
MYPKDIVQVVLVHRNGRREQCGEQGIKPNRSWHRKKILMEGSGQSYKVKPKVHLRSENQASEGHPDLLMCSMYGFYPPVIDVYWLRDGNKVTGDVFTEEMMETGGIFGAILSNNEIVLNFTLAPSTSWSFACIALQDFIATTICGNVGVSAPQGYVSSP